MSTKTNNKLFFMGSWYSHDSIKKAIKVAFNVDAPLRKDVDLQEVVDAIVRGNPTRCANFISALQKRDSR